MVPLAHSDFIQKIQLVSPYKEKRAQTKFVENKKLSFIISDALDVVYVDFAKGTIAANCGRSKDHPCKRLEAAISKARGNGIVHLIGDYVLVGTIPLSRSLTITTTDQDQGRIVGRGLSGKFAFRIEKECSGSQIFSYKIDSAEYPLKW